MATKPKEDMHDATAKALRKALLQLQRGLHLTIQTAVKAAVKMICTPQLTELKIQTKNTSNRGWCTCISLSYWTIPDYCKDTTSKTQPGRWVHLGCSLYLPGQLLYSKTPSDAEIFLQNIFQTFSLAKQWDLTSAITWDDVSFLHQAALAAIV